MRLETTGCEIGPSSVGIVSLGRAHVREAAAVLSESHGEYPAFRHLFPDANRRRLALAAFFRAVVGDAERLGASHVAVDRVGTLVGVSLWLPPGAYPWSPARKLKAAPELARVAAAAPRSFPDFVRTGAATERAHPTEPHWYLETLGVRPDTQGHAIGTQLLGLGLARAERERAPVYLETARRRNVGFYTRFGFVVVADSLQLVPGGPTHWGMRRPPGGAASDHAAGDIRVTVNGRP